MGYGPCPIDDEQFTLTAATSLFQIMAARRKVAMEMIFVGRIIIRGQANIVNNLVVKGVRKLV